MNKTTALAGGAEGLSDSDRQLLRDSIRELLASRWPADKAVERSSDAQAVSALWVDMAHQDLARTVLHAGANKGFKSFQQSVLLGLNGIE